VIQLGRTTWNKEERMWKIRTGRRELKKDEKARFALSKSLN
jgi:hypothetical protein